MKCYCIQILLHLTVKCNYMQMIVILYSKHVKFYILCTKDALLTGFSVL